MNSHSSYGYKVDNAHNKNANSSQQSSKFSLKNLSAYHLVLLVQFLVLLPHLNHLPIWLNIYAVIVIVSQLDFVKSRLPFSKRGWRVLQLSGFVAGAFGLYLTYRTAFGLDIGVSFLLLCLVSKLLELFSRRDGYVVLSLSLFVLAGAFLMSQSLGTTLLVMLGITGVFYAMIAHNDITVSSESHSLLNNQSSKQSNNALKNTQYPPTTYHNQRLRSLGIVSLLAIPLMIVLFIFFPRLPPLWSMQLSGAGAKTGMSDSMSPGDFASLSKSTELAFRVLFTDNKVPPKNELYWRGMVFSQFDGTTWRASGISDSYAKVSIDSQNFWLDDALYLRSKSDLSTQVYDVAQTPSRLYTVIMQPTNQNWLFGLDTPFSPNKEIALSREFTLQKRDVISQRFTYQARQFQQAITDAELTDELRQDTLALPSSGNTQAKQFAKQLFAQSNNNPEVFVNAILRWIRTENFNYTLSPPKLDENRIDSFLFGTRQGFCEHYASAFTYLMRSVGIPARVVVGYQGGELGSDGKSWEVRQMDAHAWTEVWLSGKGWQRVDPTAAIAPERVNNGMNQLTQNQGAALFGTGAAAQVSYQRFKMLQRMRKAMDHMSFIWQRDVVGFDQDSQKNSLLKWFNLTSQYQQIMVMFGLLTAMIATFVAVQFWRRRKKWHSVDVPMVQLSKRLKKQGMARLDNEGVLTWLDRVGIQTNQTELTTQIAKQYRKLRYSGMDITDTDVKLLQKLTKQISI